MMTVETAQTFLTAFEVDALAGDHLAHAVESIIRSCSSRA